MPCQLAKGPYDAVAIRALGRVVTTAGGRYDITSKMMSLAHEQTKQNATTYTNASVGHLSHKSTQVSDDTRFSLVCRYILG